MAMVARRELTDSERDCASRLRRIWEQQRSVLELTQEKVAMSCGWSTQGAFGHYLQGKNPLNIDAVFKLARALGVNPCEIMPALRDLLIEFFPEISADKSSLPVSEEVMRMALSIQALPAKDRAILQAMVDALSQSKPTELK